MKQVILLLLLPLLFSCKKNGSTSNMATSEGIDLSDVLNTDDYFKTKKKRNGSAKDSVEIRLIELSDINSDGKNDSAFIIYNNFNSKYTIRFTCFDAIIEQGNVFELQIKDIGDLNNDGNHEIILFLQSEESCWDEIKLYSYVGQWVEKYNGLTYQCTNNSNSTNYQFRKINDRTVQLTTYGINKDSIDISSGDTLENIIPNAPNANIITW
jgi:hypothetical protein